MTWWTLFHHAALTHGGRDTRACLANDTIILGDYAAFVLDPQGNNIEAVYHGKAERSAGSVAISFSSKSGRNAFSYLRNSHNKCGCYHFLNE